MTLATCNRSTKPGFMRYWRARPYLFRATWGYKTLSEAWEEQSKLRLESWRVGEIWARRPRAHKGAE